MVESKRKSKELIATLSQLENAIRAWETSSKEDSSDEKTAESTMTQAPQIAQSLLKRLREQIDELSD